MKTKKTRVVTTMRASSAILGIPLEIVQEAKNSGSPAFKSSGRVDADELREWIANSWRPMPPGVFAFFHAEWMEKVRPKIRGPLGIADSIEEASRRTGLTISMLMALYDAGSKAFLDRQ